MADKYASHVEPRLAEITQWIAEGAQIVTVCLRLGIATSSMERYRQEHQELEDAIRQGWALDSATLVGRVRDRAIGMTAPDGRYYPPDYNAARMLLRQRETGSWCDRATIDVDASIDADTSAALQSLVRKAEKRTKKSESSNNT